MVGKTKRSSPCSSDGLSNTGEQRRIETLLKRLLQRSMLPFPKEGTLIAPTGQGVYVI
jgi:hypothetical protein